jgi:uncharacterized membrane protein (DUF441 family)
VFVSDFTTSVIRTIVPVIVGSVLAWLASRGIRLDDEAATGLSTFLVAVFTAAYYILIRLVERKYPGAGALLGSPKKPEYSDPNKLN